MKNPFSPDAVQEQPLNRNGFDMSKSNLFTTEWGRIMPLYNVEVIPGDTFNLDDVTLDIQGMPTIFPLLSKVDVSVSYYYCRNRNVHDEFEDFIFNTKDVECPWLRLDDSRAQQMISTNSLMESFGVPSTIPVHSDSPIPFSQNGSMPVLGINSTISDNLLSVPSNGEVSSERISEYFVKYFSLTSWSAGLPVYVLRFNYGTLTKGTHRLRVVLDLQEGVTTIGNIGIGVIDSSNNRYFFQGSLIAARDADFLEFSVPFDLTLTQNAENFFIAHRYNENGSPTVKSKFLDTSNPIYLVGGVSEILDATDSTVISQNPFVGTDPSIRLNAFLPRHYEMVCNYFYRNDKNNPYMLHGEPQYNEFIPTHASGPDDNVYKFHYRNYELDRFTSCTQSPQFGDAPLVGLTYNVLKESADLTFQDTDGNSYNVTVGIDGEGRLSSIADFSKDIPSANLRKLQEMVNYGVSINDLRVTNSFQRFKENVLRRGLRYRNQMMSHFHTSVDYPDIDIPQYIGGFNGTMNAVRNENMTASEFANLGDFNGGLYGNFRLQNPISFRIPEHGFIIGLVTIVPIPAYPQSIEKSLIKTDPFEFFLPEFAKIGNVPVTYREVMPLQNAVGQSPDDVFGYNKAWYEYMRSIDEIHGDFRTSLNTFSVARQFAERPELSEDFTTVNPDDLNHVFIADNIADKYNSRSKFLCHSYHTVRMIRPIPVIGTPSIE